MLKFRPYLGMKSDNKCHWCNTLLINSIVTTSHYCTRRENRCVVCKGNMLKCTCNHFEKYSKRPIVKWMNSLTLYILAGGTVTITGP